MNEFDFIDKIRKLANERGNRAGLVHGIGDDAAIFNADRGTSVVVSSDLLVESVDFDLQSTEPQFLGHKALAVSLSDIAAMGARPRWAVISIGVPPNVWQSDFTDSFYAGLFALADRYGVTVVGGDVSRTPDKLVIDSMVLGECAEGRGILRSGASVGDQIFVTGFLGDAAAGLRLLEHGARVGSSERPIDRLLLRQLKPEPRVGWGLLLGDQQLASAMIDISDGMSSDLNHLCVESEVGALIEASAVPIDPLVIELSGRRALDPLMLALHGGEDFELLFTVKPENVSKLPKRVDGVTLTQVGEVKEKARGVFITEGARTWQLEPGGWKHFA
jgi:thiamine-monophosphate kinase